MKTTLFGLIPPEQSGAPTPKVPCFAKATVLHELIEARPLHGPDPAALRTWRGYQSAMGILWALINPLTPLMLNARAWFTGWRCRS